MSVRDETQPSLETLQLQVEQSANYRFTQSKYFSAAWNYLQSNIATILFVEVVYFAVWIVVEFFFWHVFGRFSLHHSHEFRDQGVFYFESGPLVPGTGVFPNISVRPEHWRERDGVREVSDAFQVIHVLALFMQRVFLFYPGVASFYVATFNAMRNAHGIARMHDYFAAFELNMFGRIFPASALLFALSFVLTLHWLLMPLFLVSLTLCVLVLPMAVENRHVSTLQLFSLSLAVAKAHFVPMLAFVLLCLIMQLLGVVLLLVGFFVMFPLAHAAICFMYHHMVGVTGVKRDFEPMDIVH